MGQCNLTSRLTRTVRFASVWQAVVLSALSFDCNFAAADEGQAETIQLRTSGLPTQVFIPGDPRNRPISAFEIKGTLTGSTGQGTIRFDASQLKFNEFGDATIEKAAPGDAFPIEFKQIPTAEIHGHDLATFGRAEEIVENRRLYELVFEDELFRRRMFLAISTGATGPHRLILSYGTPPGSVDQIVPTQVLELSGLPKLNELLPAENIASTIRLSSPYCTHNRNDSHMRNVSIGGKLDGPGTLDLDPNNLSFNAFGDPVSSTMMGHRPTPITLKRINIPDPSKTGRTLFELFISERQVLTFRLVLATTDAGPHRLLVYEADSLKSVLPLCDASRRQHLRLEEKLAAASLPEQQAIHDLRNVLGYDFRFIVKSGVVTELRCYSAGDISKIAATLSRLPDLEILELIDATIGPAGIPNLKRLRILLVNSSNIDTAGLASLQDLKSLEHLHFRHCDGVTDEGLAYLSSLSSLHGLTIYLEQLPGSRKIHSPLVSDAGLVHLKGLTQLEDLNLMGQAITDAGLASIRELTHLKQLSLSGDKITDAGLKWLHKMSNLEQLNLYKTQVTPAGRESLQSVLPKLQKGF